MLSAIDRKNSIMIQRIVLFCLIITIVSLKVKTSEVFCPNPDDFSPCLCDETTLVIDCSEATHQNEISRAFSNSAFGSIHFHDFNILFNDNITELTQELFHGITFRTVNITRTQVQLVETSFFSGQYSSLLHLELTHNQINDFPFACLSNFKHLSELNLNYNAIPELPPLPDNSLMTFYIAFNELVEVGPNLFYHSPRLLNVVLLGNHIKFVDSSK